MTKIYTISDETSREQALAAAEAVLKNGGVAAIPTDTVYGFAAAVHDEEAVARLYEIKGRSQVKAIAVLLADPEQAEEIAETFSEKAKRLALTYWPGGLTIIIQKKAGLPPSLSSNDLVGLRIPDHDFTRELIRRTGPLAVTSANISGEPPAKSLADFSPELIEKLDIIIDDGPAKGGIPSSVIRCDVKEPLVLREGTISERERLSC